MQGENEAVTHVRNAPTMDMPDAFEQAAGHAEDERGRREGVPVPDDAALNAMGFGDLVALGARAAQSKTLVIKKSKH